MRAIPFTKTQAVGNDFLIVEHEALAKAGIAERDYPGFSRRICDRHLGLGADGLEIILSGKENGRSGADWRIRIFNSDGSEPEISGNGTRCVAAYLIAERGAAESLRIATKAGVKQLRLIGREGYRFTFEMGMGEPHYNDQEIACSLETAFGRQEVSLVNVGNPQCVVFVEDFAFDWRALGREIETHSRFPNRTNVSFVKDVDPHTIDVRFWERGAGETASSGTGSTGAAVAAILSGNVNSPVSVRTVAGEMRLRWEREVFLEGPAEIVAKGEYYYT